MTSTEIHHQPASTGPSALVSGFNHVAIMTGDLDRFTSFYAGVFDAEVVAVPAPPGSRAATVRLNATAGLTAMEVPGNAHVAGSTAMMNRGHVDHVAFEAATPAQLAELRRRLVAAGASDGAVSDYGSMLAVGFVDPDGMATEVVWLRDGSLADLHPPEPFTGDLLAL